MKVIVRDWPLLSRLLPEVDAVSTAPARFNVHPEGADVMVPGLMLKPLGIVIVAVPSFADPVSKFVIVILYC